MTTAIEWTDTTWNPTTGCDRVSPGCDHCYALTMAKRLKGMGSTKYQRDGDPSTSGPGFGITAHRGRVLDEPLRWRKPRRVFVNSMSDLFHDGVPDGFIGSVFEVMAKTPQHTYQVLTKRHGRMRSLLNRWAAEGERHDWAGPGTAVFRRDDMGWVGPIRWPLPNVWLGVSVEDQKRADLRIPALLDTPAAVRFLSCEPLLGPVDLTAWTECRHDSQSGDEGPIAELNRLPRRWRCDQCASVRHEITTGGDDSVTGWRSPGLHWVIVGGESGPGARPMHPAWARQLRDQCTAAAVPFFFKQAGDWQLNAPRNEATHLLQLDGQLVERTVREIGYGSVAATPQDLVDRGHPGWARTRRVGKALAGRRLEGRTWDEFPAIAAPSGVRA